MTAPRQHPQPPGRQPDEPELIRTALRLAFICAAEEEAHRRLRPRHALRSRRGRRSGRSRTPPRPGIREQEGRVPGGMSQAPLRERHEIERSRRDVPLNAGCEPAVQIVELRHASGPRRSRSRVMSPERRSRSSTRHTTGTKQTHRSRRSCRWRLPAKARCSPATAARRSRSSTAPTCRPASTCAGRRSRSSVAATGQST